MNKAEQLAIQINRLLLEDPNVISYKEYENKIQSLNVKGLEEEVKLLQKMISSQRNKGTVSDEMMQDYENKIQILKNHPLIVNYLYEKEEVNKIIQEIITIIQNNL